jgi:hypothetical protein
LHKTQDKLEAGSTMAASPLDDIFELLTLATHLEDAKENRVEAATKVCVSLRDCEQQFLLSTTDTSSDFGVVRSADAAALNARLNSIGTNTISFFSFYLLSSILLHTYVMDTL